MLPLASLFFKHPVNYTTVQQEISNTEGNEMEMKSEMLLLLIKIKVIR